MRESIYGRGFKANATPKESVGEGGDAYDTGDRSMLRQWQTPLVCVAP